MKTLLISSAFLAKSMAQLTQQQQGTCLNERSNCLNQIATRCSGFTANSSEKSRDLVKQTVAAFDCNCENAKTFATW